ncbi:hypothetical protein [Mucilaginibacter sp. NFR10]|uniref:hypothetical protein n=1 Tax=Mucilaginibacter sp. NFR10 TaxID=1566292 RepID=UPI00087183DD|nr:hypothetical protein [Mucilaginibacter sp. NFR10]SCW49697.1 hypothetical protein SAMN03159284_01346 [Mucilaginibacter sp. NFR10]
MKPLTNVLLKIFAGGFFRVHAGILLFVFLAMVGIVPPQYLIGYHKSLMLAMDSSWVVTTLVFTGWFIYAVKSWHYVSGQIFASGQHFLFYSSNALSKGKQLKSWFWAQAAILLPIILYAFIAVGVGFAYHYYLLPVCVLLYLTALTYLSAVIYTRQVNRLIDGSSRSILLRLSSKWRKPYFSLYIYHLFDKRKVPYLITKALSWLIITAVFYVFADVKTDFRVAGIAILAVITTHIVLIFEERKFEENDLGFSRNLPYSRPKLFLNFISVYFFLLIPEGIWLFSRFNPLMAAELLFVALSTAMLFHCLLYWFGLNMDKYLQWVLGLFIVLFWIIMFKLLWILIPLNLSLAYLLFYNNYYKFDGEVSDKL